MTPQTEAWLCDYVRTPIGRYGGALAHVRTDDLAALPIRALMDRCPGLVDAAGQVILGCANQSGEDNRNVGRMAGLLAGLPDTVPGITLNRLCASGMDAIAMAARMVALGEIDVAIAGGVESMTRSPMVMAKADAAFSRNAELFDTTLGWRFVNAKLHDEYGSDTMPETGEAVAEAYAVSREDQDAFAFRSQQRAEAARKSGRNSNSMIAVQTPVGRKGETVAVTEDEHPRPDSTLEKLAKLRPIVKPEGTITAGNASGINDGAAACVIASPSAAERLGLTPIVRILGTASMGVAPRIMGMGPVSATQNLLERLGRQLSDFDVIELNEAFASQSLACLRELGLADDEPNVNPNGGAIALGHPLGMSGTRIVGSAACELARRGERYALATMCVGVGQGVALAMERIG